MLMEDKKINKIMGIVLGIASLFLIVVLVLIKIEYGRTVNRGNSDSEDGNFSVLMIQKTHQMVKKDNYMISPYSIEVALSMVREGADGETLSQMEKVVPERKIKDLSIPGKVGIANALFIKNSRKKDVKSSFQDILTTKYQSEILYDDFKTPKKINDWVYQKTNKMIPKVLEQIDPDFVLGIANAISMEEEWQSPFSCNSTYKDTFYMKGEQKKDVSMMFRSFDESAAYYSDGISEAVILPYKRYDYFGKESEDEEGEQLEFIGILPKDIDTYIDLLSLDVISRIDQEKRLASSELEINVSLPKFEFDYGFKEFKKTLMGMGLSSMFNPDANLKKMSDSDLYISEAIHKTYVKVDENGTKAAAVTFFGTKDNAALVEKDSISIVFDKPFIFMIKDTSSNEILFFGVVYKPNDWKEKSCKS